jgi:hypothetical protein
MDARARTLDDDRRRQHGVFTLAQAMAARYSRPAIRRRLVDQTWIEVAPRVYAIATGTPPSFVQCLHALVLSTGGVACGESAAWLHGLGPEPATPTVLVHRRRRRAAGSPHSTDALPTCDVTVIDGIPCTTAARTVIDLAACRSVDVEALVDDALARGIVRARRLEDRARALLAPRRRGAVAVLRALDTTPETMAKARSRLEITAVRALRHAGAPPPEVNHPVRSNGRMRVIDLAWPEHMVAVELDGYGPHRGRRRFDDDRARQNDLVAAGWTVFRLTWTALQDPDRALAPVLAALRARSPR